MEKFLSSFMSILMAFSLLAPSISAQNISSKITTSIYDDYANSKILDDKLLELVEPFIEIKDGIFVVNDILESRGIISRKELEIVQERLDFMNEQLTEYSSGELTAQSDNTFVIEVTDEEVERNLQKAGFDINLSEYDTDDQILMNGNDYQLSSKEGVNKIVYYWFGMDIYLTASSVNLLTGVGASVAGVALAAMFPFLSPYALTIVVALAVWVGQQGQGPVIIKFNVFSLTPEVRKQ